MGFLDRRHERLKQREINRERSDVLEAIALRESIKQSKEKLARESMRHQDINLRREVSSMKRETFRKKYVEPIQRFKKKTGSIKPKFKPKKSVFETGRNPFQ